MKDNPKKILIVEDEPSLVFTLKDTLEAENYEVEVVSDGNDALDKVKEFEPDLMILDLMLPNVSGYDICKKIRDLRYTFPIIMLTARDQEIDKVTGLNIGADDYITKPSASRETSHSEMRCSRSFHGTFNIWGEHLSASTRTIR